MIAPFNTMKLTQMKARVDKNLEAHPINTSMNDNIKWDR